MSEKKNRPRAVLFFADFPLSSTAWRTKLMGGTGRGSCMVNTICGVFGWVSSFPSPSRITGTVMVKGLVSGPTTSTVSPAANLFRRLSVARPLASQSVTTAQICQSRRYRALS